MQNSPTSAATLAGVSPSTKRGLAPEGRLQITKGEGDRVKPATNRRGFARNVVGKPLLDLETEIDAACLTVVC
jgi:hypothetical protein